MASIKQKIFFFFFVKCRKSSELTLKHIWVNRSGLLLLIVLQNQVPCWHYIIMCGSLISKEDTPMWVHHLILLHFPHLVMNHQNDENWEVTGISKMNICHSRFLFYFHCTWGLVGYTKILYFLKVILLSQSFVLYSAYSIAFLHSKEWSGRREP